AERDGGKAPSPDGARKATLLHLLCTSREPLGLEMLFELAREAGACETLEGCRDLLSQLSQYLLTDEANGLRPWHTGLGEYVRGEILGREGCRRIDEVYCSWLAKPGTLHSGYGLRHRVRHLLSAGRHDDAAALLLDPSHLEAKASAGLIYE